MEVRIKSFNFHGKEVRFIEQNQERWFFSADVAKAICSSGYRQVVQRVVEEGEKRYITKHYFSGEFSIENQYETRKGRSKMLLIHEKCLQKTLNIIVKPLAREFKDLLNNNLLNSVEVLQSSCYTPRNCYTPSPTSLNTDSDNSPSRLATTDNNRTTGKQIAINVVSEIGSVSIQIIRENFPSEVRNRIMNSIQDIIDEIY